MLTLLFFTPKPLLMRTLGRKKHNGNANGSGYVGGRRRDRHHTVKLLNLPHHVSLVRGIQLRIRESGEAATELNTQSLVILVVEFALKRDQLWINIFKGAYKLLKRYRLPGMGSPPETLAHAIPIRGLGWFGCIKAVP